MTRYGGGLVSLPGSTHTALQDILVHPYQHVLEYDRVAYPVQSRAVANPVVSGPSVSVPKFYLIRIFKKKFFCCVKLKIYCLIVDPDFFGQDPYPDYVPVTDLDQILQWGD